MFDLTTSTLLRRTSIVSGARQDDTRGRSEEESCANPHGETGNGLRGKLRALTLMTLSAPVTGLYVIISS
jgi:hypothetical protein